MSHIELISATLFLLLCFIAARILLPRFTTLLSHDKRLFCGLIAAILIVSAFLFRPHEDTFTALDHSGYRLMSLSFASGRGFHEVDKVLPELPLSLRNACLLLPHMHERNTRDRSFTIKSLEKSDTEPFFYPFLPLMALGSTLMTPSSNVDLFVPFTGVLLFAALALLACERGRWWGLLTAAVIFFGTPLPSMLYRGFYAESVGGTLVGLSVLDLYSNDRINRRPCWTSYLALGLAACMHPVYIVFAIPLAIIFALDIRTPLIDSMGGIFFLGLGLLPLFIVTRYVCAPYGELNIGHFIGNYRISTTHRLVHWFVAASGFALVLAVVSKRSSFHIRHIAKSRWTWMILLALSLTLVVLTATVFADKLVFQQGLRELRAVFNFPFGLLILLAFVGVMFAKNHVCDKALLIVFTLTLPVFTYLKGAEQMGMWSQRRLISSLILLSFAVTPWLAKTVARTQSLPKKCRLAVSIMLMGILPAIGFSNMARWPAPYFTRVEAGAWEWVQSMRDKIGDRLTFFDYHPYSFPFVVDNQIRAFGIGEQSYAELPNIIEWLALRAIDEPVLIISAYQNPGIELGFNLREVNFQYLNIERIVSRMALPAVRRESAINFRFINAIPSDQSDIPAILDKTMDGGQLALRGRWGRSNMTIRAECGKAMSATWSRESSGVIGPVPNEEGAVNITIWGCLGSGQNSSQTLYITPPWCPETKVEIKLSEHAEAHSATLTREVNIDFDAKMGEYRISSSHPYDPSLSGIRGFHSDLGALIHRIRIELQAQ